jgi:hypothetical protein
MVVLQCGGNLAKLGLVSRAGGVAFMGSCCLREAGEEGFGGVLRTCGEVRLTEGLPGVYKNVSGAVFVAFSEYRLGMLDWREL